MHGLAALILLALTLACARAWRVHQAVPSLVLLCAIICGWNALSALREVADSFALRRLDTALSPLTVGATFHFVSAYVGRARELRVWRWSAYGYLIAVSAAALSGPVFAPLANFAGSRAWAVAILVSVAVIAPVCTKLLWDHWRAFRSGPEATRTWMIGAGLVVASALFCTALIDQLVPQLPDLSAVGSIYLGGVFWYSVVRADLLHERAAVRFGLVAFGLTIFIGLGLVVFLSLLEVSLRWFVIALPVVFGLTASFLFPVWQRAASRRRQREELIWSGVLSQQLAHDVQNPLSAILGAAEFLREERRQGRSLDAQHEFVELVAEEATRASSVISRFERLYRMDTHKSELDLLALARKAADAASLGLSHKVVIEPASEPARIEGDEDLVRIALDNLIRNAVEASAAESPVFVRVSGSGADRVAVSIRDDGHGMSPRLIHQVLERGYSRKEGGLGLGLAFASRVARAHGGRLDLVSEESKGSVVTMQFERLNEERA